MPQGPKCCVNMFEGRNKKEKAIFVKSNGMSLVKIKKKQCTFFVLEIKIKTAGKL